MTFISDDTLQDCLQQALQHPEQITQEQLTEWLSDNRFRDLYVLAKDAELAMLYKHKKVDADRAFQEFLQSHSETSETAISKNATGSPGGTKVTHMGATSDHHKTIFKRILVAAAAIAAVVVCLWTFYPVWSPSAQRSEVLKGQAADSNSITLTTTEGTVALGQGQPLSDRVIIRKTGEIVCRPSTSADDADVISTITVPQGKVACVVLPDGSKVWLNTKSSVTYPMAFLPNKPRQVTIHGEALLSVKHDSHRPFIVTAGNVQTEVLGTIFDVKNYEGESPSVTLVSGRVRVSSKDHSVVLHSGQMAEGEALSVKEVFTDDIIGWKDGLFAFTNQTLEEALREMARWYGLSVVYQNREHANDQIHLSGERSWQPEKIIEQINTILGTHILIKGNTIVVE